MKGQTLDQLNELKLSGMKKALEQQDYKVIRHVVYGLSALVHENDRHQRKDFSDDSKTGLN